MNKPLLTVKNLEFKYPMAADNTLKGITFDIKKGEFVAIIGGNGSGKSTLCKALIGLIPHYITGDFKGEIVFKNENIIEIPTSIVARKIGYVYQDFENQLVRPKVIDEIEFAPLNFGYDDFKTRAIHAMDLVGITHLKDQFIWQLSGGEKHLLAIASVLALDPEVIILDEPIAQLDPLHGVEVYELLKKLNEQYHKTIIVIEHHTSFIKKYCHEIICIKNGELEFKSSVTEAHAKINKLIQHALLTQESYKCDFENENLSDNKVLVQVENVSHQYRSVDRSFHTSLKSINLNFKEGERVVILGGNGAGKSTLMKLMTGLLRLKQGDIKLLDHSIKNYSLQELSAMITYLYQNPEDMFLQESIKKDIELFPRSRNRENIDELSETIMTEFNLQPFKHRDGRLLSGGQQRRATLAIGMAMTPSVMLLDEPTASLDVSSKNELFKLLNLLKEQIKVVIISTHDLSLVSEWANRVIVMSKGEVVLDTTPDLFLKTKLDLKRWGLIKEESA